MGVLRRVQLITCFEALHHDKAGKTLNKEAVREPDRNWILALVAPL